MSLQDHKSSNEPEKERIQNAGGSVMIQRVNGSLAVSRALGDFEYKNVEGKGPTEQLGNCQLIKKYCILTKLVLRW